MNTPLSITESAIIASISQVVALVVGFGIIDSTAAGEIIAASSAAVNAAFLIGNAIHALAHSNVVAAQGPKLVHPESL